MVVPRFMNKISPGELHQQLLDGKNLLIIDVRMAPEFEEVHLPESVSIPIDMLDVDLVKDLAGDKEGCVIMCHSGRRAILAYEHLEHAEFRPLWLLDGGLDEWIYQGLPVVRGREAQAAIARQVQLIIGLGVAAGVLLSMIVHPWFLVLPALFGLGLVAAAITGRCYLAQWVAKMPWNRVEPFRYGE